MKQIDAYVNTVYQNVGGNKKEIKELKEEMRIHLIDAVNDLKEEGISEEKAIEIAIKRFGDEKFISNGLTELFKYQKKFTTNLFRVALLTIVIAVASFFLVINLQEEYRSSLNTMTQGVLDTVQNSEVISSNETAIIEKQISGFEEKYDTLAYLGIFYDEVSNDSLHAPNEAQYIYPENANISLSDVNYGVGVNNWFVEAYLEDDYREYFYLIPYTFFIISFLMFLVWLVSKMYNRNQRFNLRIENNNSDDYA